MSMGHQLKTYQLALEAMVVVVFFVSFHSLTQITSCDILTDYLIHSWKVVSFTDGCKGLLDSQMPTSGM